MAKKWRSSRKGKKAWRANISTEDIEDFYEKSTKDALSGGSLTEVPSDSLFFVDKSRDLSVKRKIDKHREKILRVDSILQKNPFVQPVPSSNQKKCKRKQKEIRTAKIAAQNDGTSDFGMVNIWDGKGTEVIKTKKAPKPMVIPAVEVEPPGCSYNPSSESHQDSLARAVADELEKVYAKELHPEPIPSMVPGEPIDEEDMYFLDVDNESDDNDDQNKDFDEIGDADFEKRPLKTKRVTRVEVNKRARKKEKLKLESEAKKVEDLSREIDSLPDIIEEIAKEDEEKSKRHQRRIIAKRERLKCRPPRLGRYKFQPAPVQVLLSEEITGSLRMLKPCSTLARDRYKSLEKRGIIVPTAKSGRK